MSEETPIALALFLAIIELAGGAALLAVGVQAVRGRLRRNRWAGYRTRSTLEDDASWSAAHSAGGSLIVWSAVPLVAAGLVLLTLRLPLWATVTTIAVAITLMSGSLIIGTRRAEVAARSERNRYGR